MLLRLCLKFIDKLGKKIFKNSTFCQCKGIPGFLKADLYYHIICIFTLCIMTVFDFHNGDIKNVAKRHVTVAYIFQLCSAHM